MLAKMEDQYDTKNIQDTPKQITQFQHMSYTYYITDTNMEIQNHPHNY
jgi:hypothetical protein